MFSTRLSPPTVYAPPFEMQVIRTVMARTTRVLRPVSRAAERIPETVTKVTRIVKALPQRHPRLRKYRARTARPQPTARAPGRPRRPNAGRV